MRLRYTRPALADLASVLDYIAVRSPNGAARVHARIQSITNLLLQFPEAGRVTEDPTIRRMTTTPYPYVVFYEIAGEEIVVHATRHAARNPSSHPGSSQSQSQ
jgi:plasmid stabilization system protein ParE